MFFLAFFSLFGREDRLVYTICGTGPQCTIVTNGLRRRTKMLEAPGAKPGLDLSTEMDGVLEVACW